MKDSVGASFAQQPAAPEAHRSPGVAGSTIIGMLEVIERNFAKNLVLQRTRLRLDTRESHKRTMWPRSQKNKM